MVGLSRCRTAKGEDIWDDLWRQEAHHSTALEGNTLILDQVRKLLDKGLAVGSKELRESLEVRGTPTLDAPAAGWGGAAITLPAWTWLTIWPMEPSRHLAAWDDGRSRRSS